MAPKYNYLMSSVTKKINIFDVFHFSAYKIIISDVMQCKNSYLLPLLVLNDENTYMLRTHRDKLLLEIHPRYFREFVII